MPLDITITTNFVELKAKLAKLKQAISETLELIRSIHTLYVGLEELKLGAISIDYDISGEISMKGTVGRVGKGRKRDITSHTENKKLVRLKVVAYSYRGYRGDSDPLQGGGIKGVLDDAF